MIDDNVNEGFHRQPHKPRFKILGSVVGIATTQHRKCFPAWIAHVDKQFSSVHRSEQTLLQ